MSIRKISRISKNSPTREGAGVNLFRVFGYNDTELLDPFLLLDDFHSENPNDYMAGFPWHPHRGIETVTYMIHGSVEHGDSIGNTGVIQDGDVQWMTAGGGIIHQEMPKRTSGLMQGFQLWVNLPKKDKMMEPRYRDVQANTIPEVSLENGVKVKVISGTVQDTKGPVQDIVVDIEYLDVEVPPKTEFELKVKPGYTTFAYIFGGSGYFAEDKKKLIEKGHLVLFDDGDAIKISTQDEPVRFLLASGKPLREPIAWYGPIVMNTQKELDIAFMEYRNGTFTKHK
jgi:redox-sensitive bicupin YhaK (pirin superfamily)